MRIRPDGWDMFGYFSLLLMINAAVFLSLTMLGSMLAGDAVWLLCKANCNLVFGAVSYHFWIRRGAKKRILKYAEGREHDAELPRFDIDVDDEEPVRSGALKDD